MKLSRTTWLVVAAGVLIIALAGVGLVWFQQVDEQNQLKEQLALAQSRLREVQPEKLSSKQAELEKQLIQATSQFEAVKAMFSQSEGGIAASSILFDIAKAYGVEVTEMTSSTPATESLEGVTCSVILLTIRVEGDVSNLVGLVTKLNSYLTTGVVKSITITIPETNSEESASVDIQLTVYTHQGG